MTRVIFRFVVLAALWVFVLAFPAMAQGPYTITGTLSDAAGKPLYGVTVTVQLWSDSLFFPLVVRGVDESPGVAGGGCATGAGTIEAMRAPYTYTISDMYGAYEVGNLWAGTYTVHPQWQGMAFVPLFDRFVLPPGHIDVDFSSDMILIEAGVFNMGCDVTHNPGNPCDIWPAEWPMHEVYLDTYTIDKHEVTNAQYRKCVTAGDCAAPRHGSSHTRDWYYGNPDYDNHPVVYISWENARDYCAWAGKRLPTEAEWERAARGASDGRAYPWGYNPPSCGTTANAADCEADTSGVRDFPAGASPDGAMDMSGNVWEFVTDWYSDTYYYVSSWDNPTGPSGGANKVVRGGSFDWSWAAARVTFRAGVGPGEYGPWYNRGFRCAGTPPPAP